MDVEVKQPTTAKEIFVAACRLSCPVERAEFLDGVCHGNADLRQHIEELMNAAESSRTSPLDRVAEMLNPNDPATDAPPIQHPPVDIDNHPLIGPYKLLEQIGEGGMGVVYMAEQQRARSAARWR